MRSHADEEVLDRVESWVDGGRLEYVPGSDAAERLDAYINKTTRRLEERLSYGLPASPIREAYDAVTKVSRRDVIARRRAGFEGMREQVRRKAELFMARREAVRPLLNVEKVEGDFVNEKLNVRARDITGSQIGHDNIQAITSSFNRFSSSHDVEDDLSVQMKIIADSVAALVAEIQAQYPDVAREISETFDSFAEESAKDAPRAGTLRLLGQGLISAGQKVAKIAVPLATAVSAVMQIFGIPVL